MKRTDDELLALAARAVNGGVWHPQTHAKPWNPLTDDGDALRLAVKLELLIETHDHNRKVEVMGGPHKQFNLVTLPAGADRGATTRRAIVECAANIGASL